MTTKTCIVPNWIWGILSIFFWTTTLSAQAPAHTFTDDTQMPNGIVGERIVALLSAMNANDPVAVQVFLDKHMGPQFRTFAPPEEITDAFISTYKVTGGLDFYSIRSYIPARPTTTVIAKDRLFGGWHGFTFVLEGPEQRMEQLNFSQARTPTNAIEPPLTEAAFLKTISEKLDELCQKDVFSGTFLIAKGNQVLLEKACGEATKSWHIPINIDTKFNLGSMNKMFTATAVMQLVEQGKIQLNDPISKYVDESWLPHSITDRVQVHHLLSHTAGFGSYFNETYEKSSRDLFRQLDDYKPLVKGDTLSFEPGTRFQYSNTGMLLLGVVIEKASGMNYFTYIQQKIYQPAGMDNSDSYELDKPHENLAEGYIPLSGGEWKNNLFLHVLKGGPAGGGYATVRDLHRFALSMQTGKLLEKSSLEKMWKSQSEAGYGYGFEVGIGPKGKVVGHGGGFPGLNSGLEIGLDDGYIIAIMSNYDMGAEPLKIYVRGLLANRLQH